MHEEAFIDYTCHAFSEMRLLIEGAVKLYEEDAGILCRLARDEDKLKAWTALNDIGTALYAFRRHVRQLQDMHRKETLRLLDTQKPL